MEATTSLHDFFTEHLHLLAQVIQQGYQSPTINLPKLDPLTTESRISSTINTDKTNLELECDSIRVLGLSSLSQDCHVHLSLSDKAVSVKLNFEHLAIHSPNFKVNGDYKPVLFKHHINKQGELEVAAKNVTLTMTIALVMKEETVSLQNQATDCHIDNLAFHLEDSFILSKLLPFFKSKFERVVADNISKITCQFLNDKFQHVCQQQQALVKKLASLYALKQRQAKQDEPQVKPRILQGLDGVGELPIPMFWQIPCINPNNSPHIELEKLINEAQTGDLILFAGSHPSSLRIRRLTQSRYSHVVLVIREPEFNNGQPCVWQATSSTHEGVLRNNERKSGIQLNNLKDMLLDYRDEDAGSVICYRKAIQTDTSTAVMHDNWPSIKAFIHSLDGKPYTDDMDGLYIMGLMEIDNPNKEDYFCAGLVAETLMKMQLLDRTFRQYQYAPRDFSELQTSLPVLQPQMHYGAETIIENIYAN